MNAWAQTGVNQTKKRVFFSQKTYQRIILKSQDTEHRSKWSQWSRKLKFRRDAQYHVIQTWAKNVARSTWCLFTFMSRCKVAVAMAHTLVFLKADTSLFSLFVCLFCKVGTKVVERCQFHWVRDDLRLLAVPPEDCLYSTGEILFLALWHSKSKH